MKGWCFFCPHYSGLPMYKRLLILSFSLLSLLTACSSTNGPVTEEHMIISPQVLTFGKGDSTKQLSVTHSCTCPFTWYLAKPTIANWLTIPTTGSNDNTKIPVSIDRTLLAQSTTNETFLVVTSNGYPPESGSLFDPVLVRVT